ncbi:MAG: beta-lactamase family protein [Bryobacteraceae bacterium]|nr:beta-lactamase family protein [Bryobacteraceae bacterium]MDW8379288.1 serine hydrolase domain-containing protein [Bryobacterales bacterium]
MMTWIWLFLMMLSGRMILAEPVGDWKQAGLDPKRLAQIAERMKDYVDRGELAGVVTLVSRHGVLGALHAAGWADAVEKKPMRTDSIFQIMSMTKPVCATAIMMLVEEGRLALHDPVEKYLPEFRGQMMVAAREEGRVRLEKPKRPVTVRDLMTHTSGMTGPPPSLAELYTRMDWSLADAVRIFAQQPLEFEPGTRWLYSNTGIATLGRLVEVASGMSFEKFLEARIFQPLGMKDSFLFPPADKLDRIVVVHSVVNGKIVDAPATILGGDSRKFRSGARYSAPEFGMYSTASDLATFYNMLRAGGVHGGARLLSKTSVQVMTALHTGDLKAGHNPGCGFGLGWEVTKEPAGTLNLMSVGSYGHGGAFGTHGWVDPAKDLVGVFLMQHAGYSGNAKQVFIAMAGAAAVD